METIKGQEGDWRENCIVNQLIPQYKNIEQAIGNEVGLHFNEGGRNEWFNENCKKAVPGQTMIAYLV